MKKYLIAVAVLSFAVSVSAFAGPVNQAVISPSETVDLASASVIDYNTGTNAVTVYDAKGTAQTGAFGNPMVLLGSDAFKNYFQRPATTLYYNLSQSASVTCNSNNSVVSWYSRPTEIIPDGCAFSDAVKAVSRR